MKRIRLLWLFAILFIVSVAGLIEFGFRGSIPSRTASLLVLSTSDKIAESLVLDRLSAAGVQHPISESGQWLYIDDFEGPKSIPLKEYYSFIEPMDPRNDGYADVLKEIFVSGGSRRYFIPLTGLYPWNSAASLIRKLEKSLSDLKPSFRVSETGHAQLPWWLTGLVMSGILAYTALTSSEKHEIVLVIPAALVLMNFGVGAILCTGLLAALQMSLGQFQKDLVLRFYSKESIHLKRYMYWYKGQLIYGAILLFLYLISAYFFHVHWFIALGALAVQGAAGLLYMLLRLQYYSEIGHRYFLPIELMGSVKKRIEPFRVLFPFSAGAFFVFVLFLIIPGFRSAAPLNNSPPIPLTIDQYQAHLNTQARFSMKPLYSKDSDEFSYNTYSLDSKGLLAKVQPAPVEDPYKDLALPPLESLLSLNYSGTMPQDTLGQGLYLVICISGVLVVLYRASHGTLLLAYKSGYLDKRIAA